MATVNICFVSTVSHWPASHTHLTLCLSRKVAILNYFQFTSSNISTIAINSLYLYIHLYLYLDLYLYLYQYVHLYLYLQKPVPALVPVLVPVHSLVPGLVPGLVPVLVPVIAPVPTETRNKVYTQLVGSEAKGFNCQSLAHTVWSFCLQANKLLHQVFTPLALTAKLSLP